MKNLKMLYIALIALVASTFGACTNEFEPGPQMPGPQVSFLSSNLSKVDLTGAESENTQKLTLTRIEKEEELTVDLLIEVDSKYSTIFSIPETVTFAAGESTTELVYTVNQSRLEEGKIYTVNFLIADEMMSTPYGYTEWKVDYEMSPWELMTDANGNNAKGKFRGLAVMDSLLGGLDFSAEIDVDIYKHKKESKYRIKEPWAMSIVALFESLGVTATVDQVKASFDYTAQDVIIDVSDPTNVIVPLQAMGLDDVNYFWSENVSLGDFFYQGYGGTLEDGVITFPVGSFFCNCGYYRENGIPDDDPDYCAGANGTGLFRVILPGYEAADYSLAVEYNGMDVTTDDVASAKIKFTYGNDVTGIKYMIVKGNIENNPTEALATLFAGTDENILTVENFVKGGKTADLLVALESDSPYTILAAPVNKKNQLYEKGAFVKSFYFRGIGAVEEHPCEFEAMLVLPSEFNPTLVEMFPDQTSLICMTRGKDLTSVSYYLNQTAIVNTWEGTLEELVAEHGDSYTAENIADMNAEYYANALTGLQSDTKYTLVLVATNSYGESKTLVLTKNTAAVTYDDYTGELVIGKYNMSCTMYAGTENETTFSNIFTVAPNGTTGTDFLVQNIGYDFTANGVPVSWRATYDATASTLTLSGEEFGYEQYGNQFGENYLYFDDAKTKWLRFCSYATEESEGKDPLVLTVDPATKAVNGMQNLLFALPVIDITTNEQVTIFGYFLGANTTIAPYVASDGDASPASVMSAGTPSVQTLINNIKMASLSKKLQSIKSANSANLHVVNSGIKTVKPLSVKSYTPEKSTNFKLKTNIKAFAR